MTDTLSREQVEMRLAQWDAADPIVKHSTQATHWEDCWRVHSACACELLGDALRTALAAMDERDAQVKMLAVIQSSAMAQGAATCASMDARIAQLEGENAKLKESLRWSLDMLGWHPGTTDSRWVAAQALLSSPGRAPETRPDVECSCDEWEPGTAKLDAPAILAQARNPHLSATPQFQFTPFRFCPWCGHPVRTQSRVREAATRTEGSSEKSRAPDVTEEDARIAYHVWIQCGGVTPSVGGTTLALQAMGKALESLATRLAGRTPATAVTATEIEKIAFEYDHEYRGGVGRGDIDLELAERLAAWFNARSAPATQGSNHLNTNHLRET